MKGLLKKTLLVAYTVLLILPLLISPVGADWVMFRGDLNRTGVVAGDWTPGEVSWNFSTGDKVRSSPAISNGIVYVTSYDGYIYALDGITGTQLWNFKTAGSIETSAVISNGTVFVASQDGKIYALNSATGTEVWSKRIINGYHTSTPAVADGVVYFGSGNGTICALNATDGSAFWGFRVNCNPFSCPAVTSGVVYIGAIDSSSGQMYALNATTGAKIWNFSTQTPNNMVWSSPAVANGVVYFGADDRNVYALDAATGAKIWSYYTGALTDSSPAVVNGVVYIGANNGNLYALDAASGAKLWSFTSYNCITSSPAVLDGVVYVGSWDNNLYAVNASNGIELWRYTTGNSISSSPTVTRGGEVYIGSDDSHLYCLNSKSISPYYQINGGMGTNNSRGIKQFITINTDGTITPSTVPIVRDGNRYILTGDIGGSVKILKDNIIFDGQGHTIYGNGSDITGGDITLNRRDHVTVMNTIFTGWFGTAISLGSMDTIDPDNRTGSSNCIITNNTITGGTPDYCFCIWVEGTNNSITNNHIYNNKGMGVALERGTDHLIANNLIESNGMFGISFEYGQATVQGNRFNNNTCGPYEFTDNLMGMSPAQNIDSSNLVDGKPTYYWIDQHNKAVPTDAGVVILINCSYITVSGLNIDRGGKYNSYSIYLADTTNSIISDNTITEGNGIRIQENKIKGSNVSVLRNNITTGMFTGCNTTIASNTFISKGIRLGLGVVVAYNNFTNCDVAVYMSSYNSTIRNNNFQSNQVAFHMFGGGNNRIYQNNFIANSKQAEEQHSDVTQWPMNAYYTSVNNTWNQPLPVGGNYWSDYTGHDNNGDGFGDTAYHVIENYYDQYPIVHETNTTQPASENVNPKETADTPTDSVNPTDNPLPAATQNPLSSEEPNQTNPATPNQPLPWISAITGIGIIGIISVILVVFRLRRKPQVK